MNNINLEVNAKPDLNAIEIVIFFDIVGLDVPTQSFSFLVEPTR